MSFCVYYIAHTKSYYCVRFILYVFVGCLKMLQVCWKTFSCWCCVAAQNVRLRAHKSHAEITLLAQFCFPKLFCLLQFVCVLHTHTHIARDYIKDQHLYQHQYLLHVTVSRLCCLLFCHFYYSCCCVNRGQNTQKNVNKHTHTKTCTNRFRLIIKYQILWIIHTVCLVLMLCSKDTKVFSHHSKDYITHTKYVCAFIQSVCT